MASFRKKEFIISFSIFNVNFAQNSILVCPFLQTDSQLTEKYPWKVSCSFELLLLSIIYMQCNFLYEHLFFNLVCRGNSL